MGRIIGIDVGTKRIGIAVSDPTYIIATPYQVIDNTSPTAALTAIANICQEVQGDRLVVGLPLNMDGSRGPAAQKAMAFADTLREKLALPVEMWDERMSTMAAERALIEGDTRRERRKQVVDKVAAQIILQSYLDSLAE